MRKEFGDLQVSMDIDADAELVRLRGPRETVQRASAALQAFVDANYMAELAVDMEDEGCLLSGGENSLVRKLQQQFGIDIHVNRKAHITRLRGNKAHVDAARDLLQRVKPLHCTHVSQFRVCCLCS